MFGMPLEEFEFFPELPLDLRFTIWELLCPGPRIVYLEWHVYMHSGSGLVGEWIARQVDGESQHSRLVGVNKESRDFFCNRWGEFFKHEMQPYTALEPSCYFNPDIDALVIDPTELWYGYNKRPKGHNDENYTRLSASALQSLVDMLQLKFVKTLLYKFNQPLPWIDKIEQWKEMRFLSIFQSLENFVCYYGSKPELFWDLKKFQLKGTSARLIRRSMSSDDSLATFGASDLRMQQISREMVFADTGNFFQLEIPLLKLKHFWYDRYYIWVHMVHFVRAEQL